MACCEFHNHLDKKLHQLEYGGATCGSTKFVHKFPDASQGGIPQANDAGEPLHKKEYCCFDCPTLVADKA